MSLIKIPKKLPLLFIQNDILLPGSTMKIPISGHLSMNMVRSRLVSRNTLASSIVGVISVEGLKDFETALNDPESRVIGTAALVLQVVGAARLLTLYLAGVCRFTLDQLVMEDPYPMGVVTQIDYYSFDKDTELPSDYNKMVEEVRSLASAVMDNNIGCPHHSALEIKQTIKSASVASLADFVMSLCLLSYEEKKEVLCATDPQKRLKIALSILQRQLESLKLLKNSEAPRSEVFVMTLPKEHKLLRTRPRSGDGLPELTDGVNEIDELQNKIVKANLPPDVNKVIMRDMHRLKKMGPINPEHSVIRNYIEFLVELPWGVSSSEVIDINKAREDLDMEHYAMDKVKRRVLEYLAVRQLKASVRGPILCFVGPPGVGKTSIGRSIAHTLGRQFQRISLGGVSNQSDIRGHRRTYIGAMPGRIIQAIKNAGVNNPVILLDEIDKMSCGVHGDPAAALLEVLDPLQNHHFLDHYLNVPFDLSQVTFIATANLSKTIPAPLLDRMETISVRGYTLEEKVHIAQNHLLPKQLRENGLDDTIMQVPLESMKQLITSYTSEAGVRSLERRLAALCRAIAVRVAEQQQDADKTLSIPVEVTEDELEDILGPAEYTDMELGSRGRGGPGVAVGLAWTEQGGCLTLVEASRLAGGGGELILTGQLGSVMKESAHLALNWVRSVAHQYGLAQNGEDLMTDTDIHIHFPAGAVGKEGPSAGVTIATALISLFADVPLVSGLAITGELTLRGVVLPVGGVREKLLAAHRKGLKKVILPKQCIKDLFYVPQTIKEEMSFLFVAHMDEVIDAAFDGLITPHSQQSPLQSRL